MTRDEIRKLVGGYATGTLTDEERQALLEAALTDQRLFDALADEEALRELLSDPAYRRELASILTEKRPGIGERLTAWWRRPIGLALAGGLATALAVVIVYQVNKPPAPTQQVAMNTPPAAPAPLEAEEAPAVNGVATPEPLAKEKKDLPSELARRLADTIQQATGESVAKEEQEAFQKQAPAPSVRDKPVQLALSEEAAPMTFAGAPKGSRDAEREETALAAAAPAPQHRAADEIKSLPEPRMRTGITAVKGGAAREMSVKTKLRESGFRKTAASASDIQYRVEKQNPDGSYSVVDPQAPLDTTDAIRLSIVPPPSGYIYVVDRTSPANVKLLYTATAVCGARVVVPAQGNLPPPSQSGDRQLMILYSAQPMSLEALGVSGEFDFAAAQCTTSLTLHYR